METNKWEGKRSITEAEKEEDEHGSVEEDSKRKRVLTLSGRKLVGEGSAHPSCQVDQCTADMADAKPYHRRHKVCEFHSKSPIVLISGLQKRFCQQCSRFPCYGTKAKSSNDDDFLELISLSNGSSS
uniref:SBP-type domain-containing protein n=1 Tax=Solanum lycopersicum TaxID=4081 RepID=A0A3Q7F4A8_SOLLC|nr:SQUAMOSA promoter binding protein-like isoform X4 [Solanum lycopersicum]